MRDPSVPEVERARLFKEACNKHQDLYRDAMSGRGVDRYSCSHGLRKPLIGPESRRFDEPLLQWVLRRPGVCGKLTSILLYFTLADTCLRCTSCRKGRACMLTFSWTPLRSPGGCPPRSRCVAGPAPSTTIHSYSLGLCSIHTHSRSNKPRFGTPRAKTRI